jgi:hypothetical protein
MKRRKFNLLAGTSLMAMAASNEKATAQSTASNFPTLSKTTLTPMGAERAGNAAGTIPAWTGGMTTVTEGWNPETTLPPDFFADDALLYTVNSSNMAQYASLLSEGVQTLMQKQGFSLQVYPTHRTAAAPQWVYDNISQNAGRATLDPAGPQLGFSGGFGGIPFPVPDTSNPLAAGAQIIWNHTVQWRGTYLSLNAISWAVVRSVPVCSSKVAVSYYFPYYDAQYNVETFQGYLYYESIVSSYPNDQAGESVLLHVSMDPAKQPNITWALQLGLGRVRKAPELNYDTPSGYSNGMADYDEFFGFWGALDEYDWKYIGKQEMLVPYNNNKIVHVSNSVAVGPKFPNPNVVRWELHRVWVVEATLRPGRRNVLAKRRLYVDEDTWAVTLTDAWDANGNIYHHEMEYNLVCPQLPGVVFMNSVVFNLQTGDYAMVGGPSGDPPTNRPYRFDPLPISLFQPQTLAASSTY